ncbi:hypothetical protein AAHC03_04603 [Spirometra sp. Aus1]
MTRRRQNKPNAGAWWVGPPSPRFLASLLSPRAVQSTGHLRHFQRWSLDTDIKHPLRKGLFQRSRQERTERKTGTTALLSVACVCARRRRRPDSRPEVEGRRGQGDGEIGEEE